MRTDWLTKALLTFIAAALWLLAMSPGNTPAPAVAEEIPHGTAASTAGAGSQRLTTGPATLPLRWQVPYTTLDTLSGDTHCGTSILLTNPTSGSIDVEVEYFESAGGTSMGHWPVSVAASAVASAWLNNDDSGPLVYVNTEPFISNYLGAITTDDFSGRATVHADDPRIIVTAYMVCRSGLDIEAGAKIVGMANIPTYPVQSSLDYYQAGLPTELPSAPTVAPETR